LVASTLSSGCVANSTSVASSRAVRTAARINDEGRVNKFDGLLCLACEHWWFIRVVGDARIGQATIASGSNREIVVASSSEYLKLGCRVSSTRIWSWWLRNRIKRNRNRRRD